jgi:hypothetical protein
MNVARLWRDQATAPGPRSSRPSLRWVHRSVDALDLKQAKSLLDGFVRPTSAFGPIATGSPGELLGAFGVKRTLVSSPAAVRHAVQLKAP